MSKRFLDALENALVGLLLISSYFGFFFIASACLVLAGVRFTILLMFLVLLCSCGCTHLLLRWIYRVQQKSLYLGWKEKNQKKTPVKVETNMYDKEETFPNCTVQVLTNTATGETSVGWWKNG